MPAFRGSRLESKGCKRGSVPEMVVSDELQCEIQIKNLGLKSAFRFLSQRETLKVALRSYVLPHTKYKTHPNPPKYTPRNPPLQNRNTEKIYEKYTNILAIFVYFSYFFSVFRFWRGISGVFRGVFWGSEGFCILYGGHMIAKVAILFIRRVPARAPREPQERNSESEAAASHAAFWQATP